ncbi:TrkH family potassium uptake protein [Megalodesulfovibrio paquesii]
MRFSLASPLILPILSFAAAIVVGGVILSSPLSENGGDVSLLDGMFTATSAVCVTGLAVVDTGTAFSRFGHMALLALIQAGGLGIMTFASLAFYLWRHKISMTDRIAVGQSLLHDQGFHLGRFLITLFAGVFLIEGLGALALHLADPVGFPAFGAVFHSISAFCNAGFGLYANSLMPWRDNLAVNTVIMVLIILGGLGFSTLTELGAWVARRVHYRRMALQPRLSFHSRVVMRMTAWLIFGGAAMILFLEKMTDIRIGALSTEHLVLASLFQSVTCRTAGFNTVDIAGLSSITLLFMMFLMFVGGSPGSTAGGIKTTTFRVLLGFIGSQLRRREQTVVGNRAVDADSLNKAITLTIVSSLAVMTAVMLLCLTEAAVPGASAAGAGRERFLDLAFEAFSAFATVGLSTGVTPTLSPAGKLVIMLLMFTGRLGPIVFLSAMQSWQRSPRYRWAEERCMIG